MSLVSGGGQSAVVGMDLPAPVVLKIADSTGTGVPGVTVTFAVSPEGAATIQPSPAITLNDGTVLPASRWGVIPARSRLRR
jgi:hypothetical protein